MPSVAALPDPFTTMNGTAVTTKEHWTCRREEIGAMLEHYELGEKPREPERVSGAISGNTLTVTAEDQGKTIDALTVARTGSTPRSAPASAMRGSARSRSTTTSSQP